MPPLFKYLQVGPLPTLGAQEGATCEYLDFMPRGIGHQVGPLPKGKGRGPLASTFILCPGTDTGAQKVLERYLKVLAYPES